MKKIIIILIISLSVNLLLAQENAVTLVNESFEINDNVVYIRAYKGDVLWINVKTDLKNEKKGKYYELKNMKIYRQGASDEFQYIVDKNDVSKCDYKIFVPKDGIYTILFDRGGLTKFNTDLFVQRIAANDSTAKLNKSAVKVSIPDTIHTYTETAEVYDYIRTCTPYVTFDRTPQYEEEQVFMDVSYALRTGNRYAIPIVFPYEIKSDFKTTKSIEWGFTMSVGDEVYKGLQNKIAQVATAAIDVGIGKMMGPIDDVTGDVKPSTLQKGYQVFDNLATANAIAGITGDVGEATGNEAVTVTSNVVQTITAFTGFSEVAGEAIGSFAPKIEDEVYYSIYSQAEYKKLLNGETATALLSGKGGAANGTFEIKNRSEIYYLVIENERSTDGGVFSLDTWEAIGKSVLSQYVYTNVKVFVKRKAQVKYSKGYYENTFEEVANPKWLHTEEVNTSTEVIFEEDLKPYYQIINTPNIY